MNCVCSINIIAKELKNALLNEFMEIIFSEVKTKKEKSKKISLNYKEDSFYFDGDNISYNENIIVDGRITLDDEIIILKANIKTSLNLTCSRCLETFIYPIDIDIEERFTNNDQKADDEIVFVKSDTLDITEIVENAIISSLPIKRLCSDSCKGLCQVCGANLNKETCSCQNEDVDIRLAGLQALLNNKEV